MIKSNVKNGDLFIIKYIFVDEKQLKYRSNSYVYLYDLVNQRDDSYFLTNSTIILNTFCALFVARAKSR